MSRTIQIPDEQIKFVDSEGNVLLDASLIEIQSFVTLKMAEQGNIRLHEDEPYPVDHFLKKIKEMIEPFNKEFNCNLTWAQLEFILREVNTLVPELKKS